MKVICVKKFFFKCGICGEAMPGPEVGDRDMVIDVYQPTEIRGTFYALERFGKENMFNSENFAIVPDDTADEVEAGEQEAIIYQG